MEVLGLSPSQQGSRQVLYLLYMSFQPPCWELNSGLAYAKQLFQPTELSPSSHPIDLEADSKTGPKP